MNKYKGTEKDIHRRIYRFVLDCFRDVVQKILRKPENIPIIEQLASSLTSIGANDREADAAGSRKDFIAKYTIVRKETNETLFWLSLVHDLILVNQKTVSQYLVEGEEILNIVSSIIKNARG